MNRAPLHQQPGTPSLVSIAKYLRPRAWVPLILLPCLVAVLVASGPSVSLSAQTKLMGTVKDAVTGAKLAYATVAATGPATWTGQTDSSGSFSTPLPTGTYTVTASKTGYFAQTQSVNVSNPTRVTLLLQPQGPSPTPSPSPSPAPSPTPGASCATTIQTLVNAAASGATVTVPACLYRETVTIAKPLTLAASPGAEIRGSNIVTGWTQSGSYWVKSGPVFSLDVLLRCRSVSGVRDPRCTWREQVFFDGTPLVQVASNPVSGQFAVNRTTGVYSLADDPTGRTVEVTSRPQWVNVNSDGVTIRGFRMRHAANLSQTGGIDSHVGKSNITIESNVLSDAHGAITFFLGSLTSKNVKILNNDIFRGGGLGIGFSGVTDSLVQGNRIHDNNTEHYSPGFEVGGMKVANKSARVALDNNEVYNNAGPGLWVDGECRDITFSNNRVYNNSNIGIFFEISQGAQIFGNKVWKNGLGPIEPNWAYGAGIGISSSSNVEVYNNTVAWNSDGITVFSQDRGTFNYLNGFGNYVHDNIIVQKDRPAEYTNVWSLGWVQDWNGILLLSSSNNRGQHNRYGYSGVPEAGGRFAWGINYASLALFNATPGEEGGAYLTLDEQNQILSSASIPLLP